MKEMLPPLRLNELLDAARFTTILYSTNQEVKQQEIDR
jgi:hypothetical protein